MDRLGETTHVLSSFKRTRIVSNKHLERMNKLSILLLIVAVTATFNAAEARLSSPRRLRSVFPRRLNGLQCLGKVLSACPMCGDQSKTAQCQRCGQIFMVENYAQLKAMGCITPPPSRRRLGGVSTGRRLGGGMQCLNKLLSACPACADPTQTAQCQRCGQMYMVENYAQLKAMGCITPPPSRRSLGARSPRRLRSVFPRRLNGGNPQCSSKILSACPVCLKGQTAQCTRCVQMYMVTNYAQLNAMGCITPSRRRLGGASTGRRLGGWILVAGKWIWDDMDKPLANGECNRERCGSGYWDVMEDDQNVGGGKIYGEYNKGPVKVGGEWNFDAYNDAADYAMWKYRI